MSAARSPALASFRKKRNRQQLPPGEEVSTEALPRAIAFLCVLSLSSSLSLRNWMSHAGDKKPRPRKKNRIFLPPSRNCGRARLGPSAFFTFYELIGRRRPMCRSYRKFSESGFLRHPLCSPFFRNSPLACLVVAAALRRKLSKARRGAEGAALK